MSGPSPRRDVRPSRLELKSAERVVAITWEDDHCSVYPFGYLRGYCPCAVCQGHGGAWDFVASAESTLADVLEVGHYALNFVWQAPQGAQASAAHRTGIYPFELLRDLCPCDACKKVAGRRHPWARLTPAQQDDLSRGK